jgi:hypothetical protein
MPSRVTMARRLARLESVWADQYRRMERERLYAKFAELTRPERCARIVFLVQRRMQACGIRASPGESLGDAAARTLHAICPSVGHLAPILKQVFEEAEASGR